MGTLLRSTITTAVATCALATTGCGGDPAADRADTGGSAVGDTAEATRAECMPGDLTAAITETPAPNDRDKLFRLTFSAADPTTSCYLGGPPQAMVFRDEQDAKLPVTVTTDPGEDKPRDILVDADHQAEAYVTTPAAGADTAAARTDFTMPSGGPTGTTFTLAWPSPVGSEVVVTPVTAPVS